MAGTTEIPPDTLREVDDFISDLVRAKLVQSLCTAIKSPEVSGNADQPPKLPQQGVEGPAASPAVPQTSSPAPVREVQNGKKPICPCSFCQTQRDSKYNASLNDGDLKMLDNLVTMKAKRSLALLVAAQKHTEDYRYRDPREWIDWYSQLFAAVVGISTLGAGFTFTIVFSGIELPQSSIEQQDESAQTKEREHIRNCLAASWMLFVFSIGLTSFVALVVGVRKTVIVKKIKCMDIDNRDWSGDGLLLFISFLIVLVQLLPIAAFLASAEALRQYNNSIGWATLAVTGLAGVIILCVWLWQNL